MKIIAYYRVSTKRQGLSGLGLEGQRASVEGFTRGNGGQVIASYTEIESGKLKDRPELSIALGHARLAKATLVVAKLDRLARNVAFLSALMESKVEFIACDNPHANSLTLHILAAVAEAEAKSISERTKLALAAAKRRGVPLGSARPNHWKGRESRREIGLRKATKVSARNRRQATTDAYSFLVPEMSLMREGGATLQIIADWLNSKNHVTAAGKLFTPTAVYRILYRARN